jgi:hypothetical protein
VTRCKLTNLHLFGGATPALEHYYPIWAELLNAQNIGPGSYLQGVRAFTPLHIHIVPYLELDQPGNKLTTAGVSIPQGITVLCNAQVSCSYNLMLSSQLCPSKHQLSSQHWITEVQRLLPTLKNSRWDNWLAGIEHLIWAHTCGTLLRAAVPQAYPP